MREESYRGCILRWDRDNLVYVYDRNGKCLGKFESEEEAQDHIDSLPSTVRYPSSSRVVTPVKKNSDKGYLIYMKGTYKYSRAMFLSRKTHKCEWKSAADADRYTEVEKNAILKNSRSLVSYKV